MAILVTEKEFDDKLFQASVAFTSAMISNSYDSQGTGDFVSEGVNMACRLMGELGFEIIKKEDKVKFEIQDTSTVIHKP